MQVMNYYKMDDKELEYRLNKIRDWLFNAKTSDPRHETALFALDVAYNAWEMRKEPVDDFTQLVIDTLT